MGNWQRWKEIQHEWPRRMEWWMQWFLWRETMVLEVEQWRKVSQRLGGNLLYPLYWLNVPEGRLILRFMCLSYQINKGNRSFLRKNASFHIWHFIWSRLFKNIKYWMFANKIANISFCLYDWIFEWSRNNVQRPFLLLNKNHWKTEALILCHVSKMSFSMECVSS